jgi:hypothetical protein
MKMLRFLILLVSSGTTAAAIACEYPPLVNIPAGVDATRGELLTAQTGIRTYMEAMETYLACLDDESSAAGADAPTEYKLIMASRHNAAIAEMEAVAEDFNIEVQSYRDANSDND